jgi:hypothetical protein
LCSFGQRPLVLVLERWTESGEAIDVSRQTAGPGDAAAAEFWAPEGAEITGFGTVPEATRSFVLLRLGQREAEGIFGLTAPPP